jgi:hypothetical protein
MLLVTALAAVRVAGPSAGGAHATVAACSLGAGVAAVGMLLVTRFGADAVAYQATVPTFA